MNVITRNMTRRLLVTAAALFLISAKGVTPDPRSVEIRISTPVHFNRAHVFLGIAVLGHHVGSLESGWLVKQATRGFLHIDWSRVGDWKGLVRTVQGPRDVSPQQLRAVVRAIEGLGFAPSAIRAWRVAAPVGFDGFHEGDTVLTIGEILVDLGSARQASTELAHWTKVSEGNHDPFEQIPRTNVRYAEPLYFSLDCAALKSQERAHSIIAANPLARLTGRYAGSATVFSNDTERLPERLLCPATRKPNFMNAEGVPPRLLSMDLSSNATSQVTYGFAEATSQPTASPIRDDLAKAEEFYAFPLSEPYAGTIGSAHLQVPVNAVLLDFFYDMPPTTWPEYAAASRELARRIAQLQRLAGAHQVRIERPRASSTDRRTRLYVYLRSNLHLANAMKALAIRSKAAGLQSRFAPFVAHCSTHVASAAAGAFNVAHHKATLAAAAMKRRIGHLLAARVDPMYDSQILCDDGMPPLNVSAAIAAAKEHESAMYGDMTSVSFEATVDAAWLLDGRPQTRGTRRTAYSDDEVGKAAIAALDDRALVLAARQALVDDPHIVSFFETDPFIERGGNTYPARADETLVVIRP